MALIFTKNKAGKDLSIEDETSTLDTKGLRINKPKFIVLHSSYKPNFNDLLDLHKRQYGWAGVGYHLFVSGDGRIYQARPFDLEGAHALGFNDLSIGVCFYSENGTPKYDSIEAVKKLIEKIKKDYGNLEVISHTQAQLHYINRTLESLGLEKRFPTDAGVVDKMRFASLESELSCLLNSLGNTNSGSLKYQTKKFRNCPGEAFRYFI